MSELQEQNQHVDLRNCADKQLFKTDQDDDDDEEIDNQESDANEVQLNETTEIDFFDDDIYDYSIKFESLPDDNIEVGDKHNCDQKSCQVEIHDSNNQEKPGFFGSITKLLQPLFILDL